MGSARIKPDDIAPPIDIRLIPAAVLTAVICIAVPTLEIAWVRRVPLVLLALGISTMLLLRMLPARGVPRVMRGLLLVSLACWLATPAALTVQHYRIAAEESGWHELTENLGAARMSVRLVSDPIERQGPFGSSWYATAEVEYFGRELTATQHPAKIVLSADDSLSSLTAPDTACFFGRVTDHDSAVFVNATTVLQPGACGAGQHEATPTGRDAIRTAVRNQAAETMGFAPQLLPGLILGDRSQQSEHIDHAMKISGLSHLSAVSGAHTSLIAAAATVLFRTLRLPRPVVIAAFLGTLLLFVQIVGMQPSIIRAATMGAIGAWALYFGRGAQALPILALSVIVILTTSPQLIHEVGFQLSVAATAGIVVGAQPLERWITPVLEKFLPNFWATLFGSSFAISAAAQLACQPLLLTFLDYVSVYSLLANIMATPLLPLITVPGTVAASLCLVAPGLSQLLFQLVALPASAIGWIATFATDLPGSTVPWPTGILGACLVALHWAATAVVLGWLLRRQRRVRTTVKIDEPGPRWQSTLQLVNQRITLTTTLQCVVIVVAIAAHAVAFWPSSPRFISQDWDLIGCDVGQGDMFLVRTGPDSAMVVDTGADPELAERCLRQARVSTVDLLVISHLHSDHVGGIDAVDDLVAPANVVYSTGTDETWNSTDSGIPTGAHQVTQPVTGIIDHAKDDLIHPIELRWSILSANSQTHNENNASIVMLLEIYRHTTVTTALFTGDLEQDEAKKLIGDDLIPADVDILKLSHHGAKNGGTEIIEHTNPAVAMIGVGQENSYGHPHHDILEALGHSVEIQRTDVNGTFSVTLHHSPTYAAAQR